MKNRRIVVLILVITLISYIVLAFTPIFANKSYARLPAGTLTQDIDGINDSEYPGFKQLIKNLQAKHPNYSVSVYYTGLDWNEVLTAEYQGHNKSPRNLFQIKNNYDGMWVCPICGSKRFDNGSWCCASLEALGYMMDPRNSINESDIFQFKNLEGSDVNYNDIARVVSSYGSYINNPEVIQAIVDASNQYNINGYFLVAKIINEHGKNGSTLSNGNGYNGNYVGCYNYFNIGSTGNGTANIINNGLKYAQNSGWTSRRASILGGSAIVKDSFITKYGQNTLYFQKFNVSGKSVLASHQYQQNIMAAQTQGSSLKSYYGSSNTVPTYTFIVPLYENMPASACARPNPGVANSISYENGIVQNISSSLKVRASGSINGIAIASLNNNEPIKILRRATNKVGNYYWDLIVSEKNGTYGYAAREIDGQTVLASTGSNGSSSGTTGTPDPTPTPQPTPPTVDDSTVKVQGNHIVTSPNMTFEALKGKYSDLTVTNAAGTPVTSGNIGTGYKITTGGKTYTAVKKGDTNGDGNVNILDSVVILNAIKGDRVLENEYKQAACTKNNSEFNVTDVVLLLNYIKGEANLGV